MMKGHCNAMFFKLIHGLVAVPLPEYIQYINIISRCCHSMTFRQISTSRADTHILSPPPLAIVQQWNALPQCVACLQSLGVFKTALKYASCNILLAWLASFYLILDILIYCNLSFYPSLSRYVFSVCILSFLSNTNRRCANLPRMSTRAYGSI